MKFLVSLFFMVSLFQSLEASSYIDFLDTIIDQKIVELASSHYEIEKVVKQVEQNITKAASLQEIEEFLRHQHLIDFFQYDQAPVNFDEQSTYELTYEQQSYQDLQFVVGAKLYLYYLESAQQKALCNAVKIYDTLNYWQNEKFCESQSFFQKNILRSLSSSTYNQKIERNIKQLQDLSNQTNSFLGLILHCQKLVKKAVTLQEFQQNLIEAVRLQDEFLHEKNQVCNEYDIHSIIQKSIEQESQFSMYISTEYAQCELPSHFVKNYESYTTAAITTFIMAFIYLRYGGVVVQGTQNFYEEHVRGAIERNVNFLSGQITAPQINIERIPTADDEATIQVLIEEELKQPEPLSDQSSSVVSATFYNGLDIASEWIGKKSMNVVDETMTLEQKRALVVERNRIILANQLRNPLRMPSAIILEGELKFLEVKHLINDTIDEVEKSGNAVLKDVHMTLGLTALIPALTLIGGGISASKSLYTSVAYEPMRMLVRQLDVLLNDSFYEQKSFDKEGYLYLLTEQLKLHVRVLKTSEQKIIDIDITSLQSSDLDYAQKFNVVQRMYRTYPCLIPGVI